MVQKGKPVNKLGKQFSLLIKPASADCNLNCQYCFYNDRQSDPYRSEHHHRMSDNVLASMISQYLDIAGPYTSFNWQGGEPLLMGVDFFKKAVEFQQMYGYSGQCVGNSVQTNATLITPKLADLFHSYNFLLGVSLDGPQEYHDHYRKNATGHGSFNKVIEGINILRDHNVEFNILAVVNDITVKKADETYGFFLENGFQFLQYIPVVDFDRDTGNMAGHAVKPDDYGSFLCRLFDLWYNDGNPAVSIRTFDDILTIYAGMKSEACVYMKECGNYAVIEYNGDVYPCDFFVEEPLRLGNLMEVPLEQIVTGDGMRSFARKKSMETPAKEACQNCKWEYICHCGCQHSRISIQNPERKTKGPDYLCDSYRKFFAYSQSRFKSLAGKVHKSAMTFQSDEAKNPEEIKESTRPVGRNDPCPCGSGKKYKKCCMQR